ncbi:hypothetical protein IWW34DRAFT_913195 [Fusarium oxysporum f. sp. albedinis]|nr:hypothetical protein IWW34DRAFT_913195 [Fusarium oxysporum f. sp. albedinis]
MPSTFHPFSALPTELRLRVWKDVIRPDLPANRHLDGIYNGSDFNISTYLTDAGLWTACHESRLMMQKHFLQDPWLSPPWTGYYISGGAPAYIPIRYNDDLVILQLDSLEFEKWDDETVGRLQNIHDIDIEYRAECSIDFTKKTKGAMKPMHFETVNLGTRVWLIDHNLRQKVDAPPCYEKRDGYFWELQNVSFYGADRKFSSTGPEKGGERLAHWEYINPVSDGDHRKFSLHFADRLRGFYKER